jgi:hypothetical protein
LEQSCYPEFQDELLQTILEPWYQDVAGRQSPTKELYAELMFMLNEHPAEYPNTFSAYKRCVLTRTGHRNRRRDLIKTLGLDQKPHEREEILQSINTIRMRKSKTPFPPKRQWLSESPEITQLWREQLTVGKLHDKRQSRYPIVTARPNNKDWRRVVKSDEDIIVRDAESNEIVLLVMRNFCGDPEVLEWADGVVQTGVATKKSVRLDDPGKLALVGWTSGARSQPALTWAKNLLPAAAKELSFPEKLRQYDFNCSSVYALFWNMIRRRLPEEILVDLKKFVEKIENTQAEKSTTKFVEKIENAQAEKSTTMNANRTTAYWGMPLQQSAASGSGTTTKDKRFNGTQFFQFHQAELAPPQGIVSLNYARFCHREINAHKWCVAWNTHRSHGAEHGGNFFVADYGIKVENAPNTVFVWQGTKLHGTSLPRVRPGDLGTDFRQCGLAFAMSRQLGKLLERFGTGPSATTTTTTTTPTTTPTTTTTAVSVDVNGEQEWFVDAVWDSRMNGGELEYLIKWTGEDEPGWEPAVEVNELEAIDRFHEAYPNKPGPLSEEYEDESDTEEEEQ